MITCTHTHTHTHTHISFYWLLMDKTQVTILLHQLEQACCLLVLIMPRVNSCVGCPCHNGHSTVVASAEDF